MHIEINTSQSIMAEHLGIEPEVAILNTQGSYINLPIKGLYRISNMGVVGF